MKRKTMFDHVRTGLVLLFATGAVIALSATAFGLQNSVPVRGTIQILPVQGNLYMLTGAGANIAVSAGPEGVVLVDSGTAAMATKVADAVQQLMKTTQSQTKPFTVCPGCVPLSNKSNSAYFASATNSPAAPKPVRYIINTSVYLDHVGGNSTISANSGHTFQGGNIDGLLQDDVQEGAIVASHQNVLLRMQSLIPKANYLQLPAEVYGGSPGIGPERSFHKFYRFFNNEPMQLIHVPNAITDGDSLAYFRYSDVLATGDVFVTTHYPMIDLERGGSIQGELDGLYQILDLAQTEENMQGGTWIIPGHGRLSDAADVARYRDVVTIIRDRIQTMMKKGMPLDQIKAARPTLEFDRRYATSYWTADQFVEVVYKSLSQKK